MFEGDVSVTSEDMAQICAATTQTYAKFRDFAEPYLR